MLDKQAAARPLRQASGRLVQWAAAGVLVIAGVVVMAVAHAEGPHGAPAGMGEGEAGMTMLGGPPQHMARGLDRMLDGLGVSDAQRSQIHQIAQAAAADLRSQREAARGMRERGMQIFTAPNVDAGAAEALRQQMSAQRDQASKRVLQAMLDIANVLTPEQRARIGDRMKEREAIMKDRMQRMHQEHGQHMSPPPPQK